MKTTPTPNEALPPEVPVSQTVFKYEAEVHQGGRVELTVPFSPGARVAVFVMEESFEATHDLVSAAQSNLDFWDNPYDDEDWNNA